MPWQVTPKVAMYKGANWSGLVMTAQCGTAAAAMRLAFKDPSISFFFFCREAMVLEPEGGNPGRSFRAGEAAFFRGEPALWPGSAPQCDTYVRRGVTTAYMGPRDAQHFRTVGDYTTSWGTPAIDVVVLFAASYAADSVPYLRAKNDDPPTKDPFNPNIQEALNSSDVISHLQSLGITVTLAILNGHHRAGWSEFATESDARTFVTYLKTDVVDKYGIDGIDIDDEYSKRQDDIHDPGAGLPQSLAMVTTIMRELMPDKLITKALFRDIQFFQASWNGHTLAQNLTYAWEMTYGDSVPPAGRLSPYPGVGMNKNQLSLGFWTGVPSSDRAGDVKWLEDNGYAGVMVFMFEDQNNVTLMGQLVTALLGKENWNQRPSKA